MASGEEIVKYVTQKVVEYMEMPREERKERRMLRKQARDPWTVRWFGLVPMAVSIWWKRFRNKKPPSMG